ncbi:hypothetical protein GCM10011350_02600 [Marinomonas arctica]|nr:hypothetical protein GCM10011350_02600 [Marinomonas arctica]
MTFNKELLPAPFSPRIRTTSPDWTLKESPLHKSLSARSIQRSDMVNEAKDCKRYFQFGRYVGKG